SSGDRPRTPRHRRFGRRPPRCRTVAPAAARVETVLGHDDLAGVPWPGDERVRRKRRLATIWSFRSGAPTNGTSGHLASWIRHSRMAVPLYPWSVADEGDRQSVENHNGLRTPEI